MREYAKISPQFWINENGRKTRGLGPKAQLISFYLLTNPHANMIGIYYLPITLIAHETGLSLNDAIKGFRSLCQIGFCSYDEGLEYVWVHDMAFDQIGAQLKLNDNRVKAINDTFKALPLLSFLTDFYNKYAAVYFIEERSDLRSNIEAPLEFLPSKEKEKENEQEQEKEVFMSSLSAIDNQNEPTSLLINHKSSIKKQAIEVLQFLNNKAHRTYRPVEANLKLIMARILSGATVVDCRQVIAKKTRDWKDDPKMAPYLRPATLFNSTKFEQYMGELILPKDENAQNEKT